MKLVGAIWVGLLVAAGAQQPVFRTSVDQVEVDVFVTDRSGAFVKDLAADDFEILEVNQPQSISSFSLVDLPVPARRASQAPPLFESDVATNRAFGQGRLWVILLDAPPPGADAVYIRRTQDVARRFIEDAMGPDDSGAIIHVQGSQAASQPLTRSRSRLLQSVERFSAGPSGIPRRPVTRGGNPEEVARTRTTLRLIEELSSTLGTLTPLRKAVLWIGGDVRFDLANVGLDLPFAYRDAIRAAQRNSVAIYPISPEGLIGESFANLRVFAEDTGGESIVNTNNYGEMMDRVVRDVSSYYVLGYTPAVAHRDGRFHPITVRVKRPGLSVRARRGYLAPEPGAPTARPAPATSIAALDDAVRNPLPRAEVEIELAAVPFKGQDASGSVLIAADIRHPDHPVPAGPVRIAYRAIDAEGRTLVSRTGEGQPVGSGSRFVARLALPRGRHEIRIAAQLSDGRIGSVTGYVDVPRFDDRLDMSGLIVSDAGNSAVSLPGEVLWPGDRAATTRRTFRAGDTLTVRAMVYGERLNDPLRARPTIRRQDGSLAGSDIRADIEPGARGERPFAASIPLAGLSPGNYTLAVEVADPTSRRSTITRELRFAVLGD